MMGLQSPRRLLGHFPKSLDLFGRQLVAESRGKDEALDAFGPKMGLPSG